MSSDRRARGAAIEAAARRHLERAGLTPLAANAQFRGGELDLVMREPGAGGMATVVFVEVRYRRDDRHGGGAASVDLRKRRKLVVAAQLFLAAHPALAQASCRFDVVEASGEPPALNWIKDAFRLDDC